MVLGMSGKRRERARERACAAVMMVDRSGMSEAVAGEMWVGGWEGGGGLVILSDFGREILKLEAEM